MTTSPDKSTENVVSFPASERRREHAWRMFHWEDQVSKDVWLTKRRPYALHVVRLLRKKMKHSGETGRVEFEWMANQIGICSSTIRSAIDALVERNHLEKESGQSLGRACNFRLKFHEGCRPDGSKNPSTDS
jgi:hypothetical protein